MWLRSAVNLFLSFFSYHRLVRAKDLSKCSENDLKAIFAIKAIESEEASNSQASLRTEKALQSEGAVPMESNQIDDSEQQTELKAQDESEEPKAQVLITQQINVNDYFAQKIAAKKKRSLEVEKETPKKAKRKRLEEAMELVEDTGKEETCSESTTISNTESIPVDDLELASLEQSTVKSVKGRVRFSLDLEAIKFFDKRLPPASISFVEDDDES